MKPFDLKELRTQSCLLAAVGVLAIATSGCAIDGGQLITDVVEAALNSAANSIVDTLAEHLARN